MNLQHGFTNDNTTASNKEKHSPQPPSILE